MYLLHLVVLNDPAHQSVCLLRPLIKHVAIFVQVSEVPNGQSDLASLLFPEEEIDEMNELMKYVLKRS